MADSRLRFVCVRHAPCPRLQAGVRATLLTCLALHFNGCASTEKSRRAFESQPARSPAAVRQEHWLLHHIKQNGWILRDCGTLETTRPLNIVADDIIMEILPGRRFNESRNSRSLVYVSRESSITYLTAQVASGIYSFELTPIDQGTRVSIRRYDDPAAPMRPIPELPLRQTITEGFHESISSWSGKPDLITVQSDRSAVLAAAARALIDSHEVIGFCDSTLGMVGAGGYFGSSFDVRPLVWVREVEGGCEVRVYGHWARQRAGIIDRIRDLTLPGAQS